MPQNPLVMFKILSYLYECKLRGSAPESDNFKAENNFFGGDLSQECLSCICELLAYNGYTIGFSFARTWGGETVVLACNAEITPVGCEYLRENEIMRRAYEYRKRVEGWKPFF